jgi:secreted PhoX family phosphatase
MPAVRNFHLARPLMPRPLSRRELLRKSFLGLGLLGAGGTLSSCIDGSSAPESMGTPITPPAPPPSTPPAPPAATRGRLMVPPLSATPDENNLLIPQGFKSRVIATANQPVPGTTFLWHTDPDAGAVFPAEDGGWVYVSNREFLPGGVNAIRFDAEGEIVSAYNVLPGALTKINCGGGVTPWGTWLSGEETDLGYIWECDPFDTTGTNVTRWDGCGTFAHEAATVDAATNNFYLTEDQPDSAFYRFLPATPNVGGVPSTAGTLQALKIVGVTQEELDTGGAKGPWPVEWVDIANPNPLQLPEVPAEFQPQPPTRTQGHALGAHAFNGSEGIWWQNGMVYFTTKGDRRVWAHDIAAQTLEVLYDDFGIENPIIDSVDNIVMTPGGDIIIVEDKGDPTQQATAIQPDGAIAVLVQLVGQDDSEVTGPAFSPDGRFFYFSSQRGPGAGGTTGTAGITYCIEGPWFTP